MKSNKEIDRVEMKNELQKKLREKHAGLSDEEQRLKGLRELETSDDPVARKWRELLARQMAKPLGRSA